MKRHKTTGTLFTVICLLLCCTYAAEAGAPSRSANPKAWARLQIKQQTLSLKQAPKKPTSRKEKAARMWSMCQLSQAHDILGTNTFKASFFDEILRHHRSLYPLVLPRASLRQHHDCAAYAQFKAAMFLYRAFLALPITSNQPQKQTQQIKDKFKSYSVVEKALGKVAGYHAPARTLCAMYNIAKGKRHIAKSIRSAPVLKVKGLKMTLEVIDGYKHRIDLNFVKPLLADVVRTLRIARKFGKQHKLQTTCAKQIEKSLQTLQRKHK